MSNNTLNLQEIDQEQALNLSRFFIKAKQNILLLGRKGIGKTYISLQAAKDCGYKILYVNLSAIERTDIAGYPILFNDSEFVTYKSPYFLPTLKEGMKPDSIIIFDEVDKAPHEVTAPLLEILQFKTINGKPINAVNCILTGNLMNEGAYSNIISSALLDRTAKFILNFDFNHWLDWAKLNNIHDLIMGFLARDPYMACGEIESTHYATPSPRGWTLASEALYKVEEFGITDLETITAIISGYVGNEAGLKFNLWYKYYKKFEKQILSLVETGDCIIEFDKLSITEIYVFSVTVCLFSKRKIIESKVKSKQMQYAENTINYFNKYNVEEEVQLIAIRNSFPIEFITKYKLYESELFLEKSKSLQNEIFLKK